MKRIIAIIAALSLTACATDMTAYYATQQKAIEADNNAVMALAAAAAAGNQGAIVALALRKGNTNIAPPQDKALQWASILVNPVVSVYGISKNTQVQLANIAAETERYGTTMTTLNGIASQGIDAAAKSPVIIGTEGQAVLFPVTD